MSKPRVVIFGIDGATFDVVSPLIEQGRLPHLASILKRGAGLPLRSTVPPVTAPAWVSFMTGTNPARHGFFHFLTDSHRDYDQGTPLNSGDIREKTLWQVLTEQGRKMMLIGVPFTYPPTPINGYMVVGGDDRFTGRLKTHPPELLPKVAEIVGFTEVKGGFQFEAAYGDGTNDDWHASTLGKVNHILEKTKEVALYLMQQSDDWDLMMVYFSATDVLQHFYWAHMDPTHPAHTPELKKKYGDEIYRVYERVDAAIGELLAKIDPAAHVIALSDHGFGPLRKIFFVNKWLEEIGLLRVKKGWFGHRSRKISTPTVRRILERLGLGALAAALPAAIRSARIPVVHWPLNDVVKRIDWEHTRAYATAFGINVNLKGREPHGAVAPGAEFESVIRTLTDGLTHLTDPQTGEAVVDFIVRKEEAYRGPYVHEANDLFFTAKGMSYWYSKNLDAPRVFKETELRDVITGSHRFDGIFIAKGTGIKEGVMVPTGHITDVMPTILHLLGLPIRAGLDGRVLEQIIEPAKLAERPPVFVEDDAAQGRQAAPPKISKDEESAIMDQLKNLGYLG